MRKLYLHIGQTKTGTSALQAFLAKNREKLYEDGIWYPSLGADYKAEEKIKFFSGNGGSLRELDHDMNSMQQAERDMFAGIFAKLNDCDRDVLISDEGLWHSGAWLYKNLIAQDFQLKVIVYLRRQDKWGESEWNQIVKSSSYAGECFEFIDKTDLDYFSKISQIAEIVGKENVIVRVYDRSRMEGEWRDIFSDFLSVIGVHNLKRYEKDKYQANPSLSANFVEIKRIFNGIPQSSLLQEDVREILEVGKEYMPTGEKIRNAPSFLTPEEREYILAKYHDSNVRLAENFLESSELFGEHVEHGNTVGINPQTIYSDIIRFYGMLAVRQHQELEELKNMCYQFAVPKECKGKKLVIYGIDKLGRILYKQLMADGGYEAVTAADKRWNRLEQYKIPIVDPEIIDYNTVDFVLIAVAKEETYRMIANYLKEIKGVAEEKIIRVTLN